MNANVIITAYNYAGYVAQAIDSVLAQSYGGITRIIVVDDGSTDGTADLLVRRYGQNSRVVLVRKDNGGQLSALNSALAHIDNCDLIFFLDADDLYDQGYIAQAVDHYIRFPDCDFLFCKRQYFGSFNKTERKPFADKACGFSVLRTYYLKEWIGNATSMISMRHGILKRILPIPYEAEWKVRADDCLVWGASLAGAKKYYMDKALARYRVHDGNVHYGRQYSADVLFKRQMAINRLFEHIVAKNNVRMDVDKMALWEFASIQPKRPVHFFQLLRVLICANKTVSAQVYYLARFCCGLLKSRREG